MAVDRRQFISRAAFASAVFFALPASAIADGDQDRRFIFVIQRGAADGLSILAPVGDQSFQSMRGRLGDEAEGRTKVDGFFALHPALAATAKLYAGGEALFVHAVASPYRERSHFDGQNVLETGGTVAYRVHDGWMNRLLSLLPGSEGQAVAVSPTVPLVLRGNYPVSSFAPSSLPDVSDDFKSRIAAMYETDQQLHGIWAEAVQTDEVAGTVRKVGGHAAGIGAVAAKLLSGGKARIAVIETTGWDTHAGQSGRLATQLRALDDLLANLKDGLGSAWDRTLVIVATEFGRTVVINGTGGTDHGTASAAMLLGGSVAGGRVLADWPGLKPADLYEGRDLRPTCDMRSLIAAAVAQHFALDGDRTAAALFPGSALRPDARSLMRS